ncbi:MAG: hypothetical protein AAGG01_21870 [Planctomycetota bacterium]
MLSDSEKRALAERLREEGVLPSKGDSSRADGGGQPKRDEISFQRWREIATGQEMTLDEVRLMRERRDLNPLLGSVADLSFLDEVSTEAGRLEPIVIGADEPSTVRKDRGMAASTGRTLVSVPFDDLRLTLSKGRFRPDVIMQLTSTEAAAPHGDERVYIVQISPSTSPVAVFCNQSALFTSVPDHQVIRSEIVIQRHFAYPWSATQQDIAIVKSSRQRLLNQASRDVYDEFLEDAGVDVDAE